MTLDLSTQSDIQLELLLAREENALKAFTRIFAKVDDIFMDELGMNMQKAFEIQDYSLDRVKALREEMVSRLSL